jgi:hypothetical protein
MSGVGYVSTVVLLLLIAGTAFTAETVPPLLSPDDLAFLTDMAKATLESSRVAPGAMVGKIGPNTSGGTLIRPGGREDYPAFWIRDYAMSVECGIIPAEEQLHALRYTAAHQVDKETSLPTGSVLPVGSIADHISFGGVPIFFPGILEDSEKQGGPQWGILPSLDDHFYFVRMAALYFKAAGSAEFLKEDINGKPLIDRLEAAYAMPPNDPGTGVVRVEEKNRGVNFGFFDCVTHTGDLFFASVLKYRAATDLAVLFDALGRAEQAKTYRDNAARLRDTLPKRFPADRGILRASTGLSAQPDVWGTAFAVYVGALPPDVEKAACEGLATALKNGTIAWKGGIRHVPTDADFSKKGAWEKALAGKNTYQNGAYWDTPTGWVCFAVAKADPGAAKALAKDLVDELREGDFRKGEEFGSPWECFHPDKNHRQNPIYLASVTAPLDAFQRMEGR